MFPDVACEIQILGLEKDDDVGEIGIVSGRVDLERVHGYVEWDSSREGR